MGLELKGKISGDGSGWERCCRGAEESARHLAEYGIDRLKEAIVGVFAEETIRRTVEYMGNLKKLADQSDVTTDEVQRISMAARDGGLAFEDFQTALSKMGVARKEAAEKNDDLLATFKKFGVTLDDLQNPEKRNVDLLYQMAAAIEHMDMTAADRTGLRELLGKTGDKLAETIGRLENYKGTPLVSKEDIEAIERMERAIAELKQTLLTAVAPVLGGAANWVSGKAKMLTNKDFLDKSENYLKASGNEKGLGLLQNYKDALKYNLDPNNTQRAKDALVGELTKSAGQVAHVKDKGWNQMWPGDYANPIGKTSAEDRRTAMAGRFGYTPPAAEHDAKVAGGPMFVDERAKKAADELSKLNAEKDKLAKEHAYGIMTPEQKQKYLQGEITKLNKEAGDLRKGGDEKGADKKEIEAGEDQLKLDALDKEKKEKDKRGNQIHSDALNRVGNFLGQGESALAPYQVAMEQKKIASVANAGKDGPQVQVLQMIHGQIQMLMQHLGEHHTTVKNKLQWGGTTGIPSGGY